MKVESIILDFITSQTLPLRLYNYQFETPLAEYGKQAHNIFHTPGTYSRAFRSMRQKGVFLKEGLLLTDITAKGNPKRNQKLWLIEQVQNTTKLQLVSQTGAP